MKIDHWMIFGTFAEKEFFEYPRVGSYKGVIINANMASHAPTGLGAFLVERTSSSTEYLIDPLTHAFQHDPTVIRAPNGNLKSSVVKLAEHYGEPILSRVGKRPLLPEHFSDTNATQQFVQRCLDFQRSQLSQAMVNSNASKYMDDVDSEITPYALIAPYFFLTESSMDDWLVINQQSADIASRSLEPTEKCFAAIVISKGVLVNHDARQRLVSVFKKVPVSGYVLWVDNLNEQSASTTELTSLLALTRDLNNSGEREVINLHGGYFSVLAAGKLGKRALNGVAHAPEFGEYRPVVPVGGGIPISRYYVGQLHARVRYRDAVSMFRSKGWLDSATAFHENVCGCDECRSTLNGEIENFVRFGESVTRTIKRSSGVVRIDFPTTEARKRCLKHYLQRKKIEYDAAVEASHEVLTNDLLNGERLFRDVLGLDGVEHLRVWRKIFENDTLTNR